MSRSGIFIHTFNVLLNRLALPLGAFFLLIVIARYSDRLLGEYALVTTYYYVMQTLPLLGLTPFVMREVARDPGRSADYFSSIGLLCLASSLLIILAVRFGISYSGYDQHVRDAINVAGYAIIPGILVFNAEIILTSQHRTSVISIIAISENITRVILSIVLLQAGYGLVSLLWTLFATRSLSLLVYLAAVFRSGSTNVLRLPRLDILKKALAVSPPFLLAMLLALCMSRLDFFVLSFFQSLEAIGHYAVAYRMYEIGLLIVAAFLTAIFPTIARQYLGARGHLVAAIRNFLVFTVVMLVPLTLAGLFLAEHYVRYLFPNQFPESVLLTQLFMLLFFLGGLDLTASAMLNAMDAQKHDARAMLAGSALYALGLFILVAPFGLYGAFTAGLIAITLQMLLKLALVNRVLPVLPASGEWFRLAVILVLSFIAAWHGQDEPLWSQLLLLVVLTGFVMPVLLYAGGILQPLRLLRYFRKPRYPADVGTTADLVDMIIADRRRAKIFSRQWQDAGQFAVTMYRFSRFFHLRGHRGLALLLRAGNIMFAKAEIKPEISIGAGLVLASSSGVVISADANRNVTFMARSGIGISGNSDAGAGAGIPVMGSDILFKQAAVVLGGHEIASGTTLKPGAKIRARKDLPDAIEI